METKEQQGDGAIVGSIIIIAIIVIGGTYLIQNRIREMREAKLEAEQRADNLSNDDDLGNIQTDLDNNANVNDIDQEMQ